MKARPRAVEREIAKELSLFYSQFGMSPVERIPVLGRTGPDITVNEANLAVDVKSRKQVPKSMIVPPGIVGAFSAEKYTVIGVSLESLPMLDKNLVKELGPVSIPVLRWLLHMQEWNAGACKAALVLHRPKMEYVKGTLIIFEKDWRELCREMQIWFRMHHRPIPN